MKNLIIFCTTFTLLFGISCGEEPSDPEEEESGFLSLSLDIELTIEQARTHEVSTDDFQVVIFDDTDMEVIAFERFAEMPTEVALPEGNYYVAVNSNNLVPAAFENPYYYGESDIFTITKAEVQEIIITSELANVKVTVQYTESVTNDFDDWSTDVALGSDVLTFINGETRSGYFDIGPLTINTTLTFIKTDGTTDTRSVSGTIDDPQPKDHYILTIDATLEDGAVSVSIGVDESTNDIEITLTNNETPCFITGQFIGVRYVEDETPIEENEYKIFYDEATGRILKLEEQEQEPPLFDVNLTYNENGQVIRAESIDGAYEYSYDGQGRVSEYLYYDNLGDGVFELQGRIGVFYTGTQIDRVVFYTQDGSGNYTIESGYLSYIYPNTTTNNPSQENFHQSDGTVTERSFYTYDSNPNPYRSVDPFFYHYIDVHGLDFSDNNVISSINEEFDHSTGTFIPDDNYTITYTYDGSGNPLTGVLEGDNLFVSIYYSYCE